MSQNLRRAVLAIIFNDEGKIFVGSSPRYGGYKFPSGGIDKNENEIEGLKRELKEELNLDLQDGDIISNYEEKPFYLYPKESNPNNGFIGQEFSVFKIKYRDTMKLIPQDDEFDKMMRINPKEIENLDMKHRKESYKKALIMCGFL